MSYILDALKRADAERERGTVPGLHAQPAAVPGTTAPRVRIGLWLAVAAVAAACGIAAGVGWSQVSGSAFGQPPQARGARAVVAPPSDLPSLPPTVVAATSALPPQVVPSEPPPAGASALPTPPESPAVTKPAPAPQPPARAPVAAATRNPPPKAMPTPPIPADPPAPSAVASRPAVPAPAPAPAPKPEAVPGNVPLLGSLPEETRRQIPALAITGAVYSDNPSQRLLLVNGQVLPQGGAIAPDLTVEEIRGRSAIFSFRGMRFQVAH